MSDTSNTLTLLPSGDKGCIPDLDPWKPHKSGKVNIVNKSGFEQTLSNISKGLLSPSPHDTIIVPLEGWAGTAGRKKGTYQYEDGLEIEGVRNGTIDPTGQNDEVPATKGVRSGTIDP